MECYRCGTWDGQKCDCKDGQTIFHGDCRELLSEMPKLDLVLTDPPWGVNNQNSNSDKGRGYRPYDKQAPSRNFLQCIGDDVPFDPGFLLHVDNLILWGANHYSERLPSSSFWLAWDRKVGKVGNNSITDAELAWTRGTTYRTVRIFRHMWAGYQRDSQARKKHLHPMEKPLALMTWCISWFPNCELICDPFMGSGPVLEAIKTFGKQGIGIELEEKYCEIAANRLRQEVLAFS